MKKRTAESKFKYSLSTTPISVTLHIALTLAFALLPLAPASRRSSAAPSPDASPRFVTFTQVAETQPMKTV